jgi:hypothetical protein
MSEALYFQDSLLWSEQQAELLRRLARGERVNGIDWEHVVEEIEDVGRSELHSVESYLDLLILHLLKVTGWPDSPSVRDWRGEILAFQTNVIRRFAPSMRQRIDVDAMYLRAVEQLEGVDYDGIAPLPWPDACPFTLDDLLRGKRADLEARLLAAAPTDDARKEGADRADP